MATRQRRPSVKSTKDIHALQAESATYQSPVGGDDCLYVKVTPSGAKKYVTALTVSKRIQLPTGQSRQKSKTHGLVSQFTLPNIKQLHNHYYESFKRGEDPRESQILEVSELERTSLLNRAIVDLSRERIDRKKRRGEITANSEYNDRLYIKKIESVIGATSFQEFGQRHADNLATAYPVSDKWTTADKVKKLIIKVYNDLPSDARIALQKDILHYLSIAFGKIKQKKRNDQLIESKYFGDAWQRMLQANVNPIFKDAWVLMLLTGERREAIFKAKRSNLHYDNRYPEYLWLTTKGDRDGEGANLIPTFGVLAMLLHRLAQGSEVADSQYLFPSQKGMGSLTSIKPLVNAIGGFGPQQTLATPHNLRRTIANLTRDILGSTAIANEHILHFKTHMKGSSENYFSAESKSFAKARQGSYQQAYRYLDELILCSARLGYFDRETDPALDMQEDNLTQGFICRDLVELGEMSYTITRGDPADIFCTFKNHNDFYQSAKVWSPVASFCSQQDKFVLIKDRPLFLKKLENEWANFGKVKRDLDDEIS